MSTINKEGLRTGGNQAAKNGSQYKETIFNQAGMVSSRKSDRNTTKESFSAMTPS